MSALSESLSFVVHELPKVERRLRNHLRKQDCRLVRQGADYIAVSRTTGSVEAGPIDLEAMTRWAARRAR